MTISTTLASWLVGAAVMAFSAALSVSPNPDPDPADTSFEAPRAVVLRGYGGDAMEPFVTRDGRWLIRSEVFVALTCSGAACNLPAAPRKSGAGGL